MTDTTVLLRRLRVLLVVPAGVLACDAAPGESPRSDPKPVAEQHGGTDAAKVDPPKVEDAPPLADPPTFEAETSTSGQSELEAPPTPDSIGTGKISDRPRFSCPIETWCGSRRVAGRFMIGGKKHGLCPAEVELPKGFKWDGVLGNQGLASAKHVSFSPKRTKREQEGDAKLCCYEWTRPCGGGRPLMDAGEPLLARCVERSDWMLRAEEDAPLDQETRAALAAAWLEDARFEHASVASFARVVLELLALAAPPSLVAESTEAMQDEVLHAQLCFGLASRFAGRDVGPGALPPASPRQPTLAEFAASTLVEGCVGETVAALVAMRSLERCIDGPSRSALEVIAEDETRHAALAWRTLAWALECDRDAVAEALRLAAGGHRPSDAERPGEALCLRRYGRLSAREVADVRTDAWRLIIGPMLEELLASSASVTARAEHQAPSAV